jgi:hypothetical protein
MLASGKKPEYSTTALRDDAPWLALARKSRELTEVEKKDGERNVRLPRCGTALRKISGEAAVERSRCQGASVANTKAELNSGRQADGE